MRMSSSSESGGSRRALGFLVAGALLLTPGRPAVGGEFVDDAEIRRLLRTSLEARLDDPAVPSGEALRKQLRGELPQQGSGDGSGGPRAARPRSDASEPEDRGLYPRLRRSTVVLGHLYRCDQCDDWHVGHASGVLVSESGLVLTNHHVIATPRARNFGALTWEQQFRPVLRVLHASRKHDLALVELGAGDPLPFASLAEEMEVGDPAHTVSHPDFHCFTYGRGRVTRFYLSPKEKVPTMQVNLNFAVGSSGAGIFDSRGRLGGLITSTKSVYYDAHRPRDRHLQMVIRSTVPLSTIRPFLGEAEVVPTGREGSAKSN